MTLDEELKMLADQSQARMRFLAGAWAEKNFERYANKCRKVARRGVKSIWIGEPAWSNPNEGELRLYALAVLFKANGCCAKVSLCHHTMAMQLQVWWEDP